MPLETGDYVIAAVSFISPDVPAVSRPLGEGQLPGGPPQVVILPEGIPPPRWNIVKISHDRYIISVAGKFATPEGSHVFLRDGRPGPPTEWVIIPGAPSPPPIGRDAYGILIGGGGPQESWTLPPTDDNKAIEVPILLGGVASSLHIYPYPE